MTVANTNSIQQSIDRQQSWVGIKGSQNPSEISLLVIFPLLLTFALLTVSSMKSPLWPYLYIIHANCICLLDCRDIIYTHYSRHPTFIYVSCYYNLILTMRLTIFFYTTGW